jgi:hypothetical protein
MVLVSWNLESHLRYKIKCVHVRVCAHGNVHVYNVCVSVLCVCTCEYT